MWVDDDASLVLDVVEAELQSYGPHDMPEQAAYRHGHARWGSDGSP